METVKLEGYKPLVLCNNNHEQNHITTAAGTTENLCTRMFVECCMSYFFFAHFVVVLHLLTGTIALARA